ncbi:hypothetical protein CoNPh17_CDS0149 [Staphylococcus phage S-CoN_Ph17]|nr:hypothetical protein CoNPh17_CDS0149 [Staphylococcus phage S-CoN_Ph17]
MLVFKNHLIHYLLFELSFAFFCFLTFMIGCFIR